MFYGPPSLMNGGTRGSFAGARLLQRWPESHAVLERECIGLECTGHCWEAYTAIEVADEDFIVPQFVSQTGPTLHRAIWRCFVPKLGDEVEIPRAAVTNPLRVPAARMFHPRRHRLGQSARPVHAREA